MAFQTTTTGRSIRPAFNLYAKDKEIEKEEEDDEEEYYYEDDIEEDDDDIDFVMPSTDKLISDIPESERGIGVGIDLGTTNSAISILGSDNNPKLIPVPIGIDEEGDLEYASTIPSIVTIVDEEDVYVGENMEGRGNGNHGGAYAYAYEYRHVKRIIGMGMMAAAGSAEVVPHLAIRTASQRRKGKSLNKKNIKEGKVGGGMKLDHILREAKDNPAMLLLPPGVNFDDDDDNDSTTSNDTDGDVNVDIVEEDLKTVSPEFISAQVLRKLFETAENATEERITRAVIGVPAYFNDVQREATVRAATMASSIPAERIRLLREPEAAALAYGIGKQQIGKGD